MYTKRENKLIIIIIIIIIQYNVMKAEIMSIYSVDPNFE